MAQSSKSIPANYPQPLGTQLLRADTQRQASILRQEIVTDLLAVLADAKEPAVRTRLIKLIEAHLKSGITAARKAEELWPELDHVKRTLADNAETKPALAKKHLKLFEQFDRVQRRSLALLENSFESIRLILDRVQPSPPVSAAPAIGVSKAPARSDQNGRAAADR